MAFERRELFSAHEGGHSRRLCLCVTGQCFRTQKLLNLCPKLAKNAFHIAVRRPHRKCPIDTSPDSVIYHRLQARLNHQLTSLHTADTWQKRAESKHLRAPYYNNLCLLILPCCVFPWSLTLICCMWIILRWPPPPSPHSLCVSPAHKTFLNFFWGGSNLHFVFWRLNSCPCKLKQRSADISMVRNHICILLQQKCDPREWAPETCYLLVLLNFGCRPCSLRV